MVWIYIMNWKNISCMKCFELIHPRNPYLIPSRKLTYPPKMAFWRWFSFSQGFNRLSAQGSALVTMLRVWPPWSQWYQASQVRATQVSDVQSVKTLWLVGFFRGWNITPWSKYMAQSPKGRLIQGLYKPIHGSCAIYFYPGVQSYVIHQKIHGTNGRFYRSMNGWFFMVH